MTITSFDPSGYCTSSNRYQAYGEPLDLTSVMRVDPNGVVEEIFVYIPDTNTVPKGTDRVAPFSTRPVLSGPTGDQPTLQGQVGPRPALPNDAPLLLPERSSYNQGAAKSETYNFEGPSKRHFYNRISKNSKVIENNTVIDPSVDVGVDIEAINNGQAIRDGNDFTINNRTYGVTPNGELYPKTGEGFYQLDRGEYKALKLLKQHGATERGMEILKLNKINDEAIEEAIRVYNLINGE